MLKFLITAAALALPGVAQARDLPKAPAEVPQAFERHFNARDLDALARLYGPDGAFVPAPGVLVSDPEQIRGALTQFLAARMPIALKIKQIYQAGDTALIVFDWTMKGAGADGKPVEMAGTGADVVRKQADGTWLYVLDNPFGVAQPAP